MLYYKSQLKSDRIVCLLCRHYCKIKDGQVGVCGVNKNVDKKLSTLVYGLPLALNIDPIEKKPIYHMLPKTTSLSLGTVGCNFKCPFCQNWQISQSKEIKDSIYISPEKIVQLAIENGVKSISYTYNEPTIFYPYAKDIGVLAKERGIKNIFVTNGFETPEVIEDMSSWLDGANVDLKSWSETYYKRVLKGSLEAVKDTLRLMVEADIWVEVTTLLIEGKNDSKKDLTKMAEFIVNDLGKHVPWHLSAFHPDYKMMDQKYTSIETLKRARDIAKKAGLYYVYLGNVPIGKTTYCVNCGKLLIERYGFRVVVNNLVNGCCPDCNRKLEGVFR